MRCLGIKRTKWFLGIFLGKGLNTKSRLNNVCRQYVAQIFCQSTLFMLGKGVEKRKMKCDLDYRHTSEIVWVSRPPQ